MNKIVSKMVLPLLFLAISTGLPAMTFLVDTRESMPLNEMEIDRRIRVVSTESGIMDTLFDEGHIFFNIYSVPDESGNLPSWDSTVFHAKDVGADYLLKLIPDDDGFHWEFYAVRTMTLLEEGFADISAVNPDLTAVERWTALGELIADRMMGALR